MHVPADVTDYGIGETKFNLLDHGIKVPMLSAASLFGIVSQAIVWSDTCKSGNFAHLIFSYFYLVRAKCLSGIRE